MDTLESLKTITALIDGLTTIAFAVWFITIQGREIDQQRAENKEWREAMMKQSEQLLGMVRDDVHNFRYTSTIRERQTDMERKASM